MTEDPVRRVVRAAIDRHLAGRSPARPQARAGHASFTRFVLPAGADDGGACLIEPSVACTHCGYCQSYGH